MEKHLTGFTNIQKLDPEIFVDLKYATTDNFTGQIIYDFTTAIARTGTAHKLVNLSKQKGTALKFGMPTVQSQPKGVSLKSTLTQISWQNLIQISVIKKV